MKTPVAQLASTERGLYGMTVTARSSDGKCRTIVQDGTAMEALRACCSEIDSWEGRWYVQAVSCPASIMRDLEGARLRTNPGGVAYRSTSPEQNYLGRIGRADLLPTKAWWESPPKSRKRARQRRSNP